MRLDSWPRILTLVLAVVLSLAGCGGSTGSTASVKTSTPSSSTSAASGGPSPASGHLSKAQLIIRADSICARVTAEILASKAKSASRQEIARVVPGNVAAERKGLAELSALTPPASFAHNWARILDYRRTLANELHRLLAIARANDTAGLQALTKAKKRAHDQLKATATSNGFKRCGTVGFE